MAKRTLSIGADELNDRITNNHLLLGAVNRETEVRHICADNSGRSICGNGRIRVVYRGPYGASKPVCKRCLALVTPST